MYTVGRLDSRYKGIDKMAAGTSPDLISELTGIGYIPFTPAIELLFSKCAQLQTDIQLHVWAVRPWDYSNDNIGENKLETSLWRN